MLNYRYYVLFRMPWLKTLDCHDVHGDQVDHAITLFGTKSAKLANWDLYDGTHGRDYIGPSRRHLAPKLGDFIGVTSPKKATASPVAAVAAASPAARDSPKAHPPPARTLYDDLCQQVQKIHREEELAKTKKSEAEAKARAAAVYDPSVLPVPPWLQLTPPPPPAAVTPTPPSPSPSPPNTAPHTPLPGKLHVGR